MRTGTTFGLSPTRHLIFLFLFLALSLRALADDPVNTSRTWDREVARIVYAQCASCHRQGGTAFSLTTYRDARPWATAIKQDVLERKMPPWGAVKGFGKFRNDQALTQAQIELIQNWVDGGAPEGDPSDLPRQPAVLLVPSSQHRPGEIEISGAYKFRRPFNLDGFWLKTMPATKSSQIVAVLPDGEIDPLVWLYNYDTQYGHPFLLQKPLLLPAGAVIRGLPAGATLILLPVVRGAERATTAKN